MKRIFVLLLLTTIASALPQRREFLRGDEIGLIQEAQESNDRLKLYVQFARVRMDAIDQEMAKNGGKATAERGEMIHELLYEYERIIDAIDDTAANGVEKRDLIRKGMASVMRNEPELLKRLEALEAQNPSDRESYRFALSEALETTRSSIDDNRKIYSKQPSDKKMEKEIEAEAKQEEKDRAAADRAAAAAAAKKKP